MIISHKHKLIFIKTRKVASTSIELFLRSIAGPNDACSELDFPKALEEPLYKAKSCINCNRGLEHASALQLLPLYEKEFNDYHSFTIERNPWDKTLSYFYMQVRNGFKGTLDTFLKECWFKSDKQLYTDTTGSIMLSEVILYEELNSGLKLLFNNHGIAFNTLDVKARSTYRPRNTKDYRKIYTEAQAAIVADTFAWEIKTFGYTF